MHKSFEQILRESGLTPQEADSFIKQLFHLDHQSREALVMMLSKHQSLIPRFHKMLTLKSDYVATNNTSARDEFMALEEHMINQAIE